MSTREGREWTQPTGYCGTCGGSVCRHVAEAVVAPPPERAILLDLITGLRDMQWRQYGSQGHTPTSEVRDAADRAETRLREAVPDALGEVGGDE